MKAKKSSLIVPALLILFVILVVFVVVFLLVAALAWGTGWLLRVVLPLSLFEAMLLGFCFSVATGVLMVKIAEALMSNMLPSSPFGAGFDESEDRVFREIPSTRFFQSPSGRTWEAWLRYEMANDIFVEFQEDASATSHMNDTQVQELAVRLSEIGLATLKRKNPRARDLLITKSAFKREMQRMGQRAYDDEIMSAAVQGINMTIGNRAEEIAEILETRKWQAPAEVQFDA